MREFPRTGRRITRSSELSTSRESPGLNWSSSRTGLGSTIRPVLSIVTAVTIMEFAIGYGIYGHIWTAFCWRSGAQITLGCGENLLLSCNVMHVLIYR
jgi:hypothetical protein